MSQLGHSRHSHIAPAPTNVRYAPNSDQKWCVAANDAKCHPRHFEGFESTNNKSAT
jgi:hypothetical protein